MRYLVVEDDPQVLNVIVALLALSLNEEIDRARDGQEAIDFVAKYLQDSEGLVIVSDMNMPRIDGIELAKWIQDQNIPCKYILMSGYLENAEITSQLPAISYYPKPIDIKMMVSEIRSYCEAFEAA